MIVYIYIYVRGSFLIAPSPPFTLPCHLSEVKLYLLVLDKLGKTEKRLEVIKGRLGKHSQPMLKSV